MKLVPVNDFFGYTLLRMHNGNEDLYKDVDIFKGEAIEKGTKVGFTYGPAYVELVKSFLMNYFQKEKKDSIRIIIDIYYLTREETDQIVLDVFRDLEEISVLKIRSKLIESCYEFRLEKRIS